MPLAVTIHHARAQGAQAWREGLKMTACPYAETAEAYGLRQAWMDGFCRLALVEAYVAKYGSMPARAIEDGEHETNWGDD